MMKLLFQLEKKLYRAGYLRYVKCFQRRIVFCEIVVLIADLRKVSDFVRPINCSPCFYTSRMLKQGSLIMIEIFYHFIIAIESIHC